MSAVTDVGPASIHFVNSVLQRDARRLFVDSLPFLVEAAERGDDEAILGLLERSRRGFFELILPQIVTRELWVAGSKHRDLDEVPGMVFEILLTCDLDEFKDVDGLIDYLLRSVVNEVITRHRHSKAEIRGGRIDFVRIDNDRSLQADTGRSVHELIAPLNPDTLEVIAWESEIKQKLTPREQDMVAARAVDLEMTSNVDLAKVLEITEGTVRARQKKIDEKLKP